MKLLAKQPYIRVPPPRSLWWPRTDPGMALQAILNLLVTVALMATLALARCRFGVRAKSAMQPINRLHPKT